jgi:hypothetical protein
LLLHFLLDVILALAQMGGFAFCEHPAYPTWLRAAAPPSIWMMPAMRALRLLECTGFTTIDQCVVGAVARKPTTFLHVRLPLFRKKVMRLGCAGRCDHGANYHEKLQGIDEQGQFRTSRGKNYPRQLNQLLAEAMLDTVQKIFDGFDLTSAMPEVFLPVVCNVFEANEVVQPDFYA